MTKILQGNENGVDISYSLADDTPRITADGFGPALIGFPFTTVTIVHQQISPDPAAQERKVVATLQVPTTAFIELAQNIQKTLNENSTAVSAALDNIKAIISKPL